MDTRLLLPAEIPQEAIPKLIAFCEEQNLRQEWDGASVDKEWLGSLTPKEAQGRCEATAQAEAIKLAKELNLAMAATCDGGGEEDTYEWDDLCTIAWFDPETGESREEACGAQVPTPRITLEEAVRLAAGDPNEIRRFKQSLAVLEKLGITVAGKNNPRRAPAKEFLVEANEFQGSNREYSVDTSSEGIRIHLGRKDCQNEDDCPDVFLEARPEGWVVFAHASAHEEPSAAIRIPDGGSPTNFDPEK